MKKLIDPTLIQILDTTLIARVESNLDIRRDWLAQQSRIAVLIPNTAHFSPKQAGSIACAIRSLGYEYCLGADIEDFPVIGRRWQLAPTTDDLLAFSHETAAVSSALTSKDGSFLILCTPDNYGIVAGSTEFVKEACGGDIAAARSAFREYTFEISESPADWLQKIAAPYEC